MTGGGKFFKDFSASDKGKLATDVAKGIGGLLNQQKGSPGGEGYFAENISFTASTQTTVPHNLGKTPQGFLIIAKSAVVDATLDSKNKTSITVTPNATATVTLWIF